MKNFFQLNPEQKKEAIEFARKKIILLMNENVICADKKITPEIINDYAEAAAEMAWYSDKEDMVVDGIL